MALDWLNGFLADEFMEMMSHVQEMREATYDHIEALEKDKIDIRDEIEKFIYANVVAVQKMEVGKDKEKNTTAEAGDAGPDTMELNRVNKATLWVVSTLMNESGRFKELVNIPEKPDPLYGVHAARKG